MTATEQLIHDTTIVTADETGSILYAAALLVRDGRVAALGPSAELVARHPSVERVDGRSRVLTLDEPALVAQADRIARAAWRRLFERRPELPRPPGFDLGGT